MSRADPTAEIRPSTTSTVRSSRTRSLSIGITLTPVNAKVSAAGDVEGHNTAAESARRNAPACTVVRVT
jgi:hypothetical protein